MSGVLSYLFWPNPPAPAYSSPKVLLLLLLCAALVALSFGLRTWRKRQTNAITRKLTRSWPGACLWFGIVGLFLVVCRVEGISYLSMRVWWGIWMAFAGMFTGLQIRLYMLRNYHVLPRETPLEDPRAQYLPKKK